ncbi:MAG: MarR family transcriptional regulator, partial [Actinomycetota bacterium]|nr:MarR family transcriptional regulator [Actinomycetota bacterium]
MESSVHSLLLERQLCFALSVASRSVVSAYKPVLAPLGLTHPQYLVMLALWERNPRTVKDISAALLLEPATL